MNKGFFSWCIGFIFILTACDNSQSVDSYLADAKRLSAEHRQCKVDQVLPYECDEVNRQLERIQLEMEMHFDEVPYGRLNAAMSLGQADVSGQPSDSIYASVNKAHDALPSNVKNRLELDLINYEIFSELYFGSSFGPYLYQVAAYYQDTLTFDTPLQERETFVYFYRLSSKGGFKTSDLQENFLIVTEAQIDKLIDDFQSDSSVNILKLPSFEEAQQAYENLLTNKEL